MNTKKKIIEIEGIEFIKVEADESSPAIVLMHGYGANSEDLYPLHSYLDPQEQFTWYFPNAPLEVPLGMMMSGRAWFPIDVEALNRAMMTGEHRDFRNLSSDDFSLMVQRLERVFNKLFESHDTFFIGGFSQGAMLSSHLAFRLEKKPAGLLLLSGNLIDEENLKSSLVGREPISYFQSHGTQDPLLSLTGALALHELLKTYGHEGEFHEFRGEHSIPLEIIEKLRVYLQKAV